MNPCKRRSLAVAISLCVSFPAWGKEEKNTENTESNLLEEMTIYGQQGASNVATKLELSNMETPQTVTTISRGQLDDFALTSVNAVLEYVPGVTVEQVETDRTYYTARGFDIVNFQYDGIGIPFVSGINLGQQDTAIYERVEVVKGAAGLITGLANPSATVNYVRKRPTDEFQASAGVTLGQWNNTRVDGDVSGALTSSVGGRVVAAYDKADSYLDRHADETTLFYGVIDFDLSESTKLTVGHSYDNSHSMGVLWGALPLVYTDGTSTDYDVSTSNAPDWTYADNIQQQTFLEFTQGLGESWRFNAHLVHSKGEYDSELFYAWGLPDAETEIGLNGYASAYDAEEKQSNAELFFDGDIELFGQSHQLVVGYSYSDTALNQASYYDYTNGFPVLGADWAEGNSPAMNFVDHNPETDAGELDISQESYYFSARINPHDDVAVLVGLRNNELKQTGVSYGAPSDTDASELVPYLGVTWEVIDSLAFYSSYSEVFKQQTWVDEDYAPLGATLGSSSELGVKKSFNDGRATLTVALFGSEQENFGEFVGRDENGVAIYEGVELESRGYEIEFVGELTDGLQVAAGYTDFSIEDNEGEETRLFIPKQQLTLSGTYQIPGVSALRVGGLVKWQDDITDAAEVGKQDAYTTLDLAAHYKIMDNLGVSLNIENVTDEKYLNSLYWDQSYYAAPRNVSASVRWNF